MSHKVMTEARCSDCGKKTRVPFKPTPGKPVYCRECLAKHRSQRTPQDRNQKMKDQKQFWSRRRDNWKNQSEKIVNA